jgi:spermidine synthase
MSSPYFKHTDVYSETDSNSQSYSREWKIGGQYSSVVGKFVTRCAEVCVLDTPDFGKVVLIDEEIQSTAVDQEFYHQALTRPALICTDGKPAKRVLILGGGELCTLKEILTWPHVEHVDMVDYDQTFVEFAKRRLRDWHNDCYKDERAHIYHTDAWAWTRDYEGEKYDSIILDLTDLSLDADKWPKEIVRWTTLVENCIRILRPNGTMSMYTGMYIPWKANAMKAAFKAMKDVLRSNERSEKLEAYKVLIPSFGCGESFFLLVSPQSMQDSIDGRQWIPFANSKFNHKEAMRSIIWNEDFD